MILLLRERFLWSPTSDKSFDVSKLGLQEVKVSPTESSIAQSVAGNKNSDPNCMIILIKLISTPLFQMPKGTGIGIVPSTMIQAGIGLPFSTEIDARFIPTISFGDLGKLGLWGIGLKHDIKQWIPVISHVPFWDLSLQGGYTSLKSTFSDVTLNANAFTANLLVSTDIPIINVYGGLGFTFLQVLILKLVVHQLM